MPAYRVTEARAVLRSGVFLVACVAAVKFSLHVATADVYGYFRDEFYFILLSVGIPRAGLDKNFAEVTQAAAIACAYCIPEEQNLPIYILRQPRRPLAEMWPDLRRYGM